jgi:tryptophanyl-tRNA synthetase
MNSFGKEHFAAAASYAPKNEYQVFEMNPERIVSGSKPSGELHIGNYFGANKSWVELQDRYDCFYFVADYHALTEEWDPVALRTRTLQMALDLLACGIDPERSVFFFQSDVPEHAELERMTQFKDRSRNSNRQGRF